MSTQWQCYVCGDYTPEDQALCANDHEQFAETIKLSSLTRLTQCHECKRIVKTSSLEHHVCTASPIGRLQLENEDLKDEIAELKSDKKALVKQLLEATELAIKLYKALKNE